MSESKAHQVEIREVDGQTLRTLVNYIYTAEIEVTEDNVQVGGEEKQFRAIPFFFPDQTSVSSITATVSTTLKETFCLKGCSVGAHPKHDLQILMP